MKACTLQLAGRRAGEDHKYFREYFEIGTRTAKSAALETTKTVKLMSRAFGGRRDDSVQRFYG
jgi:hypothetical protein